MNATACNEPHYANSHAFVRWVDRQRPGFANASAHMWDRWEDDTCQTVDAVRSVRAQTNGTVNGCVFILAFPTNCGIDCTRGNKHDQSWNVARMARSVDRNLLSPHGQRYPLVVYHEDYTRTQKKLVRKATRAYVAWFRIQFGIEALPSYYDRPSVVRTVSSAHRSGNLSLPHMRGTFHGFGYRMMCRFYAGLIMWSPLMVEFDWYLRVDGGDSRFDAPLRFDPFVTMYRRGYKYGYYKIDQTSGNDLFDRAIDRLIRSNPEVVRDQALFEPFVDKHGMYNGKYYYNNFEIVHLNTFRSEVHWDFFMQVDREQAFMFGNTRRQSLGDADFRSIALSFLLVEEQVHRFRHLPYRHPVSWDL